MNTNNIVINTQSSIKIVGEKKLYFDPIEIASEEHDADFIFLTHEHSDHFSPDNIKKIAKEASIILAPESMKHEIVSQLGNLNCTFKFLLSNQTKEFSRILVETVPSYNNSKSYHTKKKQWLGYVVTMEGIRYYVAGDTDETKEAKQIRCDVALIPIGGTYTMNPKEAADLIQIIGPQVAIPTHYGSIVGETDYGNQFAALVPHNIKVDLKLSFNS